MELWEDAVRERWSFLWDVEEPKSLDNDYLKASP
jgi:hypothetical protein